MKSRYMVLYTLDDINDILIKDFELSREEAVECADQLRHSDVKGLEQVIIVPHGDFEYCRM